MVTKIDKHLNRLKKKKMKTQITNNGNEEWDITIQNHDIRKIIRDYY